MAELTEQEQIRRNSLNELKKLGINPYPAALYEVNAKSSEILEKYPQDNTLFQDISIAGRIMSRRIMGAASFVELQDPSKISEFSIFSLLLCTFLIREPCHISKKRNTMRRRPPK